MLHLLIVPLWDIARWECDVANYAAKLSMYFFLHFRKKQNDVISQ